MHFSAQNMYLFIVYLNQEIIIIIIIKFVVKYFLVSKCIQQTEL